jgi:hypothetical protein
VYDVDAIEKKIDNLSTQVNDLTKRVQMFDKRPLSQISQEDEFITRKELKEEFVTAQELSETFTKYDGHMKNILDTQAAHKRDTATKTDIHNIWETLSKKSNEQLAHQEKMTNSINELQSKVTNIEGENDTRWWLASSGVYVLNDQVQDLKRFAGLLGRKTNTYMDEDNFEHYFDNKHLKSAVDWVEGN